MRPACLARADRWRPEHALSPRTCTAPAAPSRPATNAAPRQLQANVSHGPGTETFTTVLNAGFPHYYYGVHSDSQGGVMVSGFLDGADAKGRCAADAADACRSPVPASSGTPFRPASVRRARCRAVSVAKGAAPGPVPEPQTRQCGSLPTSTGPPLPAGH